MGIGRWRVAGRGRHTPFSSTPLGSFERRDERHAPRLQSNHRRGNIYVADGYRNTRVAKYVIGEDPATNPGNSLMVSIGIAYTLRIEATSVSIDKNGKFLAEWTGLGTPWNLAFDGREHRRRFGTDHEALSRRSVKQQANCSKSTVTIYTAETVNQRIQKFVLSP